MTAKRVFISFDFDHDQDLRNLLVGQARNPDTPFQISDWSVKEPFTGDWRAKVRQRIRQTEITVVICGTSTHTATGVAAELDLTRQEGHPYFLLAGRSDRTCTRPSNANPSDKMYNWTWDNLKALISGAR
jgi:hypothetical protein